MKDLPDNYHATRLQARIHDPADKALVLKRMKGGQESGSVAVMRDAFKQQHLDNANLEIVKTADHWASAADRLPWPKDFDNRYSDSNHFFKHPELRHPLSGATYDLHHLDIDAATLNEHEANSLPGLIVRDAKGNIDPRLTALALWRFGPELAPEGLSHLWRLLPADTRIPDHSIWQHLDLTTALAGAMVADENNAPALLTISIGPVQDFIAQARKTDDLWAGSHLLSQLAFVAAHTIATVLGPEQLVFPALRGVPVVDQWITKELSSCDFAAKDTVLKTLDIKPHQQQVAALPNRLLAIVPLDRAAAIATLIENRLNEWLCTTGEQAINTIIEDAGISSPTEIAHLQTQMQRHMSTLLELHWSAVPWTLAGEGRELDIDKLATALSEFYPAKDKKPGFLNTPLMQALGEFGGTDKEPQHFWRQNPGVAYSAIHDISSRTLAAAKFARTDKQTNEKGYRCSLCGEREILATDPKHRFTPRGRRNVSNELWQRLGKNRKSTANTERNEALCGVCTVKRLWPKIWRQQLNDDGHDTSHSQIVSTHVMAATPRLKYLLQSQITDGEQPHSSSDNRTALPIALYNECKKFHRIPQIMHDIEASEDPNHEDHDSEIDSGLYYGILLFDGDNMGAWLGGDSTLHANLASVFHSRITKPADDIANKSANKLFRKLLDTARPTTPAMHASLSATLNDFAIGVVPELINHHYYGQLIYAGGDDVLAMLPHNQLLQAALAVRQCWSGVSQNGHAFELPNNRGNSVKPSRGFVLIEKRNKILRTMGENATGSAGIVLVPAKMPLSRALQSVREAEQVAKNSGRNAFSISVLKRSGGTLQWTGHWPVPQETDNRGNNKGAERLPEANDMLTLIELIDKLDDERVSAKFNFHMQAWARELEQPWQNPDGTIAAGFTDMLSKSLAWQLERQGLPLARQADLATRITTMVCQQPKPLLSLRHLLGIAEFMVRKHREARVDELHNNEVSA